jgi:phospholipid/cholesterol/gamma-HCH transport system substrate-binding protein
MRRDNINYMAVGLFVLAVGVAFLWVLYRLTGSSGPTDRYYAVFDNVGGIKYGTVTYYKGYPVGQVESVAPVATDSKINYRVEFSVTKDWKMPVGSAAAIVLPGPLAPAVIDIREGNGPGWMKPGEELDGVEQADMFSVLNDAAAEFKQLTREGQPLLQNLNDRITALSIEYESLSKEQLRPLLTSLRQRVDDPELFDELKKVVKKLDASAEALLQTVNAENRQHIASILSNADKGSVQLTELLVRIEESRKQMHELFVGMDALLKANRDGVNQTVDDAAITMRELRGSIQVVADNIDTIVHYLEGSGRNMQEFSREVRENPSVLFSGESAQDPLPAGDNKN